MQGINPLTPSASLIPLLDMSSSTEELETADVVGPGDEETASGVPIETARTVCLNFEFY